MNIKIVAILPFFHYTFIILMWQFPYCNAKSSHSHYCIMKNCDIFHIIIHVFKLTFTLKVWYVFFGEASNSELALKA